MQELVGKLTALDPAASESLKVVAYFDVLLGAQVGLDVLARSAAVLAGCPAGVQTGTRGLRWSHEGRRLDSAGPAQWPALAAPPDATVWIERTGAAHTNDAMLLERLALAVSITLARGASDSLRHRAVEVAVDANQPADERASAVARLRLPAEGLRAVALRPEAPAPASQPSALVATPFGLARAVVIPRLDAITSTDPMGVGLAVDAHHLPVSWSSALVALRLADGRTPVVHADGLGALLALAESFDLRDDVSPDVAVLQGLSADPSALRTLDAVVDERSVRGAALALGLHHSTVQARLTSLVARLGYDPQTPSGALRYGAARMLLRLASARW